MKRALVFIVICLGATAVFLVEPLSIVSRAVPSPLPPNRPKGDRRPSYIVAFSCQRNGVSAFVFLDVVEMRILDVFELPSSVSEVEEVVSSADGGSVAFVVGSADNCGLWVLDVETKKVRRLLTQEGEGSCAHGIRSLAWSPDSTSLVFCREVGGALPWRGSALGESKWLLCRLEIQTGRVETLTPVAGSYAWPKWSPEGRRLLFRSQEPRSVEDVIYVLKWDTKEVKELSKLNPIGPAGWSSDGERIVFARLSGAQTDVWTVSVGSGMRVNLSNSPYRDEYPHWLSSGKIVFLSNRPRLIPVMLNKVFPSEVDFALFLMNADGSEVELIAEPMQKGERIFPESIVCSPDGQKMLYEESYFDARNCFRVYCLDMASHAKTDVTSFMRYGDFRGPVWVKSGVSGSR